MGRQIILVHDGISIAFINTVNAIPRIHEQHNPVMLWSCHDEEFALKVLHTGNTLNSNIAMFNLLQNYKR